MADLPPEGEVFGITENNVREAEGIFSNLIQNLLDKCNEVKDGEIAVNLNMGFFKEKAQQWSKDVTVIIQQYDEFETSYQSFYETVNTKVREALKDNSWTINMAGFLKYIGIHKGHWESIIKYREAIEGKVDEAVEAGWTKTVITRTEFLQQISEMSSAIENLLELNSVYFSYILKYHGKELEHVAKEKESIKESEKEVKIKREKFLVFLSEEKDRVKCLKKEFKQKRDVLMKLKESVLSGSESSDLAEPLKKLEISCLFERIKAQRRMLLDCDPNEYVNFDADGLYLSLVEYAALGWDVHVDLATIPYPGAGPDALEELVGIVSKNERLHASCLVVEEEFKAILKRIYGTEEEEEVEDLGVILKGSNLK